MKRFSGSWYSAEKVLSSTQKVYERADLALECEVVTNDEEGSPWRGGRQCGGRRRRRPGSRSR